VSERPPEAFRLAPRYVPPTIGSVHPPTTARFTHGQKVRQPADVPIYIRQTHFAANGGRNYWRPTVASV